MYPSSFDACRAVRRAAIVVCLAATWWCSAQTVVYDRASIAVIPYLHSGNVVLQDFTQGTYRLKLVNVATRNVTEIRNNMTAYLYPVAFGGTHVAWIGYGSGGGSIPIGGDGGGIGGGDIGGSIGGGDVIIPTTGAAYHVMRLDVSSKSEKTVSTDTAYKEFVAADGGKVAWTDYRYFSAGDTTVELYLYNGSESRITQKQGYKSWPHIRGNRVVWQDYRNAGSTKNADIYLYDLGTRNEKAICTNDRYQDQPCVYDDLVVWQDYRNGTGGDRNADIYLYDLSTNEEIAICTDPAYQSRPKVYGDFVVWHDYRNAGSDTANADIYGYDLANKTEFVVTAKGGYQGPPHLYDGYVVWADYTDNKVYALRAGETASVAYSPHPAAHRREAIPAAAVTGAQARSYNAAGQVIGFHRREQELSAGMVIVPRPGHDPWALPLTR